MFKKLQYYLYFSILERCFKAQYIVCLAPFHVYLKGMCTVFSMESSCSDNCTCLVVLSVLTLLYSNSDLESRLHFKISALLYPLFRFCFKCFEAVDCLSKNIPFSSSLVFLQWTLQLSFGWCLHFIFFCSFISPLCLKV